MWLKPHTNEVSFAMKEAWFAAKEGSFATKEGSFGQKEGSFGQKEGSFSQKEGSFAAKEGQFNNTKYLSKLLNNTFKRGIDHHPRVIKSGPHIYPTTDAAALLNRSANEISN